jgi:3-methyladenine DNA glycosylase AlkC
MTNTEKVLRRIKPNDSQTFRDYCEEFLHDCSDVSLPQLRELYANHATPTEYRRSLEALNKRFTGE